MKHCMSEVWSEAVLAELVWPEGELVCLGLSTAPGPEPGVCTMHLPQLRSPHGPGPLVQTSAHKSCPGTMHTSHGLSWVPRASVWMSRPVKAYYSGVFLFSDRHSDKAAPIFLQPSARH